jgi:hypothetical protein
MRYQGWDVLLFPEGSKVPIHMRLSTPLIVSGVPESPFLHGPTLTGVPFACDGFPGHAITGSPSPHPKLVSKCTLLSLHSQPGEAKTFYD